MGHIFLSTDIEISLALSFSNSLIIVCISLNKKMLEDTLLEKRTLYPPTLQLTPTAGGCKGGGYKHHYVYTWAG